MSTRVRRVVHRGRCRECEVGQVKRVVAVEAGDDAGEVEGISDDKRASCIVGEDRVDRRGGPECSTLVPLMSASPVPVATPLTVTAPPSAQRTPSFARAPVITRPPVSVNFDNPGIGDHVGAGVDHQGMAPGGDDPSFVDQCQLTATELPRAGDRVVHVRQRDPRTGARYDVAVVVGQDHLAAAGERDALLDELEESFVPGCIEGKIVPELMTVPLSGSIEPLPSVIVPEFVTTGSSLKRQVVRHERSRVHAIERDCHPGAERDHRVAVSILRQICLDLQQKLSRPANPMRSILSAAASKL